ncbi:hypothetical protein GCM10025880_48600 [Methylorubrum aminovorans]|nr:hypothetical protein GCM10025880_48600 [Methylorubrum aminovorans]
MASLEAIANTLRSVAASGMKPKALLAAVRERHPEATKKEVVRAAFYALTESHGDAPQHFLDLHGFAITERAPDDNEPVKPAKLRRKKRTERWGQRSGPSTDSFRALSGAARQLLLTTLNAHMDKTGEGRTADPSVLTNLVQNHFQRHDALAGSAVGPLQLIKRGVDAIRRSAVRHGGEMIDLVEAAAHGRHAHVIGTLSLMSSIVCQLKILFSGVIAHTILGLH